MVALNILKRCLLTKKYLDSIAGQGKRPIMIQIHQMSYDYINIKFHIIKMNKNKEQLQKISAHVQFETVSPATKLLEERRKMYEVHEAFEVQKE